MNTLRNIGLALLIAAAAWAQGYRLEPGRLIVEETHWQDWSVPHGTVQFSAAGVQSRFIREQTNAVLDASTFTYGDGVQGGIRAAGTNLAEAGHVIDGREDTFWEPDPDAPVRNWWVEIDLGRLVWVKKVVVKFAGEGQGDPFLQFKAFTSNGAPAFLQSKNLNYRKVGHSEGRNKTQRIFEFGLKPTLKADPGFSGDLIQFLQIVATGSDRGQGQEVSQTRWNSLPAALKADILAKVRETGS